MAGYQYCTSGQKTDCIHLQCLSVCLRIFQGSTAMVAHLICPSSGDGAINTAFIERLSRLTRRSRYLAHDIDLLRSGMFIVGCLYNFHDFHHRLRQSIWRTKTQKRWVPRTSATAASLTEYQWPVADPSFGPSTPRKVDPVSAT